MIWGISKGEGYDNFLKTHSDWIGQSVKNEMGSDPRKTKRAKDYHDFVDAAQEANNIIMAGDKLGVNVGDDYEPYVGDVKPESKEDDKTNGYNETHINIHKLVNKLNNRN